MTGNRLHIFIAVSEENCPSPPARRFNAGPHVADNFPMSWKDAMSENLSPQYVLCVTGARGINKRMAMFMEGIRSNNSGVRILSLPRGRWVLDKSENRTVASRIGRCSADIGQVSGARLTSVMCFHWAVLPLAIVIGLLRRVPVLYDEHDHYEMNTLEGNGSPWKRAVFSFAVRWIHRSCLPWVSLITCIHLEQQILKRHLQKWQPSVLEIHNYPARIWRESVQIPTPSEKLCFVYIGGVYYEKGVGASAEAFQFLPDHIKPNAELHVFGEGDADLISWLRTMQGVVVHNGVTPVQFRSFAATHRCCGLSLLANTRRYSLVGTNCTKLYEYLALGMPVIATRVGEFPQFVGSHQVGLLIDGDLNRRQLTEAMLALLDDRGMFSRMAQNARTLMSKDEMTWEYEWSRIDQTGVINRIRRAA